MIRTDPINLALVVLVVMNALAFLQFQSLAWASTAATSKVSTLEIAGTFSRGDHQGFTAR